MATEADKFFRNLPLLAGQWTVEMTTQETTQVLHSSSLIATKNLIAEGRYLEEWIDGEFAGARHQKRTLLGFNPTLQRYEYVTADNHDSVILFYVSVPQLPSQTNRIDLWADYVSPGDAAERGVLLRVRTTIEFIDKDSHTLTNFYAKPGMQETQFLQYRYRRQL